MKKLGLLYAAIILIVIGIGGLVILQYVLLSQFQVSDRQFSSWGERIYFTSVGKNGPISYRGAPTWLRMHGGSCASCHGTDGKGGPPIMMSDVEAPDITYDALTEREHEEEGEEEEHPPFTDRTIKRAITEGVDPAGRPLDLVMPRWEMTDEDLDELIDFLKTL